METKEVVNILTHALIALETPGSLPPKYQYKDLTFLSHWSKEDDMSKEFQLEINKVSSGREEYLGTFKITVEKVD